MTPRPKTLAEVATRVIAGATFRMELADFLDEFYQSPTATALHDEPPRMSEKVAEGHRKDTYLAAVAEHLCRQYRFPTGEWVWSDDLKLKTPHFAYQSDEARIFLLADSPPAFKGRNLFVSSNVLSRC